MACLKGLVVTGSKNVKILKYRNVTKILHGLEEMLEVFGYSRGDVQE
jgi:hypothetical protein